MDLSPSGLRKAGIVILGGFSSGAAVSIGASACTLDVSFHLSAPPISPVTRTIVTAQLTTVKRFCLKNNESFDIDTIDYKPTGRSTTHPFPDFQEIPGYCVP